MEAQSVSCPNCQTMNPAKNLFCQSCGKPMMPARPMEATVPANGELPPFEPPVNLNKPISGPIVGGNAPANDPFAIPPTMAMPSNVPPQNYPPQGYAPQGYPPQNLPPQNFPPQGFPPQGMPPQGMPPQGYPPQNFPPPQGYPPQNTPPQGFAQQGAPQQQAYYPPQPVVAAPVLEKLGARAEGWMDLVAGEAKKAGEIEKAFVEELKAREIPLVNIEKMEFSAGFAKKAYQVARHPAGSVVVSVEGIGKDLACSWALYVPQAPNWKMIGILAGIAFGVSFFLAVGSLGVFGFGVGNFLVQWIFGTIGWLWQVALVALIVGQVWKGSFWHFFLVGTPDTTKESLAALVLAVHQSLLVAVEKSGLDASQLRGK